MTAEPVAEPISSSVLIVDSDIISRHLNRKLLRNCGYAVVEAANTDEAFIALAEATLFVDVILCDISALGSRSGSEFADWVRTNRPELEVRLAGGVEIAAQTAAELCKPAPHLKRPHEFLAVVDYIKQLRASRAPC